SGRLVGLQVGVVSRDTCPTFLAITAKSHHQRPCPRPRPIPPRILSTLRLHHPTSSPSSASQRAATHEKEGSGRGAYACGGTIGGKIKVVLDLHSRYLGLDLVHGPGDVNGTQRRRGYGR